MIFGAGHRLVVMHRHDPALPCLGGRHQSVSPDWSAFIGPRPTCTRVQVPVVTSRLSRVPIFRVCLLPLNCYTTNQSALSYSYPYPALSLRAKMMLRALRAPRLHWAASRSYATVSNPQTLVEKIVQKYAVDLPAGSKVRSGDYVMIRPEHV